MATGFILQANSLQFTRSFPSLGKLLAQREQNGHGWRLLSALLEHPGDGGRRVKGWVVNESWAVFDFWVH